MYVFFGRARRSHVSNVGDQVINPGMRAWLRDKLRRRHIDHCLKIHDGLLPKHSKLDSSERTMKALLVTWLAQWAAFPLTTTHVLSSWNMVFTEVPLTKLGCSVLGRGAEPLVGTQFLEHPPNLNFGANHLKKWIQHPQKPPIPFLSPHNPHCRGGFGGGGQRVRAQLEQS